jgi:hypothetical protein
MSVDLFKAEAKRLADHLAETHGIKLKHTSVLSAIAALHGARDWNTLIGQHKPGLFKRAVASLAGTTAPEHSVVVGLEDLLYDLPSNGLRFGLSHPVAGGAHGNNTGAGGQPVDIDDRNLTRHTLVVGPTGYGWSTLLESLAVQQAMRGGGMLVLDPRSDSHMARLIQQAGRRAGRDDVFTMLFDDSPAPADLPMASYDLFAGQDTAVIARRLIAAMRFPEVENVGGDYYRVRVRELLEGVLEAMQAAGHPLRLGQLARFVLEPEQLFSLMAEVQQAPGIAQRLGQVMRPFVKQTKGGSQIDEAAYSSAMGGLAGRLALLTKDPRVTTQNERTLDLSRVFKQGQLAYATGCDKGSSNGLAHALLDELMRVFEMRKAEMSRQPKTKEPPVLLVIPNLTSVLKASAIRRLLSSAIEANVAVVAHITNLSLLEEESATFADDVLTNTRIKVFFKQPAPRAFEQAAACLDYASGAFSAEDRAATRERLMRLKMGEAVLFDGSAVRDLRIRMVRSDQ